jgi:hypothetical protein
LAGIHELGLDLEEAIDKVKAEWALIGIAHNLLKLAKAT